VIDRWDGVVADGKSFDKKLRSFLGEVSPLAETVIFVTQVPVHRGGDHVNLREIISTTRQGTVLPRLQPDPKDNLRREIASIAERATVDFRNLRILRADVPFYHEDGSILYASGRTFFYADDDHLSDAGGEFVRPLFQRAINEAQIATNSLENR
jgi:hypothetical protein